MCHYIYFWFLPFQGKNKLLELMRNHIVSSSQVCVCTCLISCLLTIYRLSYLYIRTQLSASYIASNSRAVSLANQALTFNVTAAVSISVITVYLSKYTWRDIFVCATLCNILLWSIQSHETFRGCFLHTYRVKCWSTARWCWNWMLRRRMVISIQ